AYFLKDPAGLPDFYRSLLEVYPPERVICDYIAGMTDRYAVNLYQQLSLPKFWSGI
ncbi:MAG: deoxyguanosinetriphosphate triphosphohydrolase, partial [Oscillospiraceae bacterium]|nr:deoxyguanosinetriphosphate triphosphohydrolase [Oscillospiraceae bacterium]